MNNTFLTVLLLISTAMYSAVYAQDIDPRVRQNYGERGISAYEYNKYSYNYMVFELDNGYKVVQKSDLSKEEKKLVQHSLMWTPEQITSLGTQQFNFVAMGLKLQSAAKQYYSIDDTRVLVLLPIREITAAFTASPLNTK